MLEIILLAALAVGLLIVVASIVDLVVSFHLISRQIPRLIDIYASSVDGTSTRSSTSQRSSSDYPEPGLYRSTEEDLMQSQAAREELLTLANRDPYGD